MIELLLNDQFGKKLRVKCHENNTIGDLKKMLATRARTRAENIRITKWYTIYKDHESISASGISDGTDLEVHYD